MKSAEYYEGLPFQDHQDKLVALREESPEDYLYVLVDHHRNMYFNSPEPGNERKVPYGSATHRLKLGLVQDGFTEPDVQDAINRVVLSS